jgi:catalase
MLEGEKQRIRPESFADHYSQARLFYVSQTPTEQTHIANALSFELAKVERPESFADHYSQARQFYISQTGTEQGHIADALIFELSKVERPAIRARLVSHLPNIDEKLARRVIEGLGMRDPVTPAKPAVTPRTDLKPSKALSIILNGPETFAGRKVGVLVTDGVDIALLKALKKELANEGALLEIVAPAVGGVEASDGTRVEAQQKIGGGPSVLYDAVVLLPSEAGVAPLTKNASAIDFVSDAFAHLKFIGWVPAAAPLFAKAGVPEDLDEGFIELRNGKDVAGFVTACRKLRVWDREDVVKT